MLDRPPPAGYANWTAPLLARELGDIHEQYIWRFLRAQKIDLSGRKPWCESNDPEFVSKAADVVALYMMPPDLAVFQAGHTSSPSLKTAASFFERTSKAAVSARALSLRCSSRSSSFTRRRS